MFQQNDNPPVVAGKVVMSGDDDHANDAVIDPIFDWHDLLTVLHVSRTFDHGSLQSIRLTVFITLHDVKMVVIWS